MVLVIEILPPQFTKQCPGCRTPVEKNAGCNHMTCCATKADGTRCRTEWCVLSYHRID
jgi:hypothetical protein